MEFYILDAGLPPGTLREAEYMGSGMLASRMHDTDFQGPGVSGALQPRNNMIHIQNPKKDPGCLIGSQCSRGDLQLTGRRGSAISDEKPAGSSYTKMGKR